jgi:exportin-T
VTTGINGDAHMSSGRSTPTNGDIEQRSSSKEKIDYSQYPLTPLGQLLTLCMTSGILTYPHPSVLLQYFETAVRYVEFWKSKPGSVQPVFQALLDQR